MYNSEVYPVVSFITVFQAYKEWKIISSFRPSSLDSGGKNRPLAEEPLEKPSSSRGHSIKVNPEMYKVNFFHLFTRFMWKTELGKEEEMENAALHLAGLPVPRQWGEAGSPMEI